MEKLTKETTKQICKRLDDIYGDVLETSVTAINTSCTLTFSDSLEDLKKNADYILNITDIKTMNKTDKKYAGINLVFGTKVFDFIDETGMKKHMLLIKETIKKEALKYFEYNTFEMSFKREDGSYFKPIPGGVELFCLITRK